MYQVLYTIKVDDPPLRFEPGESDLAGATDEQKANWIANGWVIPNVDAPVLVVDAPTEDAPLALTHWEGKAEDAPPGTWEYERQHGTAPSVAPVDDDAPRKRGRKE